MPVVDLYTGIYRVLANDAEILELLKLPSNATALQKAKKIQKRAKPQDIEKNLPMIAFYTPGGGRDPGNDYVFGSTFIFDIYTKDDVELAQLIAERIYKLFDGENNPFENIETFDARYEDEHESATDLSNTYCYTIIITMYISLPK